MIWDVQLGPSVAIPLFYPNFIASVMISMSLYDHMHRYKCKVATNLMVGSDSKQLDSNSGT